MQLINAGSSRIGQEARRAESDKENFQLASFQSATMYLDEFATHGHDPWVVSLVLAHCVTALPRSIQI